MTIAEKIRQSTDADLAKLLYSLHTTIHLTECECNERMNIETMLAILQKPFDAQELSSWVSSLEDTDA